MRRDLLASIRGTICLPRPAKVRVPFKFKPDKWLSLNMSSSPCSIQFLSDCRCDVNDEPN